MCFAAASVSRAVLDIAVVGAGTAGSASALFLSRLGHRMTLYERVAEPRPVGAGIVLQPTGLAVLRALGLDAPVLSRAHRIERLRVTTPTGRSVVDLTYRVLSEAMFGLGLHRGVLFETLFHAARAAPGVTTVTGVDLEDLVEGPGGVVLLERGTRRRHGPHELVVVCNGARSSLRDDTAHHKVVERYPWGALWALVPDPEGRVRGELHQVVRGTGRMTGLLPTGLGPSGDVPLVSFFFSLRADRLDAFRGGDFEAWRRGVEADFPATAPFLAHLSGPSDLLFAEYHDVVMWPWNTGRTVYLGDAAYATSPQLGQGANLALLDAWALAQCLAEAPTLQDALYAYSRARRGHLGWYQLVTRALTPLFQSDYELLGRVRDAVMGPLCRVPFVHRQMVEGMAGVARGPWCPPLTSPADSRPPMRCV